MITIINPKAINDVQVEAIKPDLKKFDVAKQQVSLVVNLLEETVVTKQEDIEPAMENLKVAANVDKAIEAKRKQLVAPWNDGAKAINTYAKELVADLTPAIDNVKKKILDFKKAEDERILKERTDRISATLEALGFTLNSNDTYILEGVGAFSKNTIKFITDADFASMVDDYRVKIEELKEAKKKELEAQADLVSAFGDETEIEDLTKQIATLDEPAKYEPTPRPTNGFHTAPAVKGLTKRWTFDITDQNAIPREYLQVNETAIREAIKAGVREIPGLKIYQSESISIR